ncbi:MAG: GNAT family N-acetyltransferase [Candidatus Odinarchaeia archaeon]
MNVVITPGFKDLHNHFISLVLATGEDIFQGIFGGKTHKILKHFYLSDNSIYSHVYTNYIKFNGEIAGLIHAYPGDTPLKNYLFTGLIAFRNIDLNLIKNIRSLLSTLKELGPEDKNNYYIAFVSIYPKYRRMKLATNLIQHIEKQAYDHNYNRLILEVEKDNTPAINLYRKLGFRPYRRFNIKLKHKTHKFIKMIK